MTCAICGQVMHPINGDHGTHPNCDPNGLPVLQRELLDVISDAVRNAPRSRQRRIGPSEIGNPCDRCLGHKLAGTAELLGPIPWLPAVGTAVHEWLDELFIADALARSAQGREPRWVTEAKVTVGEIDGQEITGSCDLYDVETCTTVDWKIVGTTTLRAAKAGPSDTYRVQQHLYGRGWWLAGHPVHRVAIFYLPRNAVSVEQGVWWSEPYDEQLALDALARADALAKALRMAGADRVLPNLARQPGCLSCKRFALYPGEEPLSPQQALDDLIKV